MPEEPKRMIASFPTEPGTVLRDRYVLQEVVYSGHWSWTLRAQRLSDRLPVTLKVPGPGSAQSGSSVAFHAAWMQRVFHSLSQVHHPNRVAVLDYLESHGLPILVQQQVSGVPMSKRLLQRPLGEQEAIALVRKIAIALSGIHGKGLIHRNVRPETIWERLEPKALGQPILTDWGLQPSVFAANRASSYAAPEQFQPGGRFQPAIDVYGLAATLYALVTGQPPLHGALRSQSELILPRQLQPQLSVALERAILQGMACNPQERPPSMGAWLGLLPEVTVPPPSAPLHPTPAPFAAARPQEAVLSGATASTGSVSNATTETARTIEVQPWAIPDTERSDSSRSGARSKVRHWFSSRSSAPAKPMKTLVTISMTAATLGAMAGLFLRVATPESVAGISSLGRSQSFPEREWPGEGVPEDVPFDVPEPEQRYDDVPSRLDEEEADEASLREVVVPEEAEAAPVIAPDANWGLEEEPRQDPLDERWQERYEPERWTSEAEQRWTDERLPQESVPDDGAAPAWDDPVTEPKAWDDYPSEPPADRENLPSSVDPYSGLEPEPVYDAAPLEEYPYEPEPNSLPEEAPTLNWGEPVPSAEAPSEVIGGSSSEEVVEGDVF